MQALRKVRSGQVIMPTFTYQRLTKLTSFAANNPRFCHTNPIAHGNKYLAGSLQNFRHDYNSSYRKLQQLQRPGLPDSLG